MQKPQTSVLRYSSSLAAIVLSLGSALPVMAQGRGPGTVDASPLPAVATLSQSAMASAPSVTAQAALPIAATDLPKDGAATPLDRPAPKAFMVRAASETMEERLNRVAYGLRMASTAICENPEMLTGLSFFDLANQERRQRPELERRFGISKGFGVRLIVPDSAASQAGLAPGDVITAVNGIGLGDFRNDLIGTKATYARIAQFETFLDQALQKGPASITIQRGTDRIERQLTGVAACGGSPVFYPRGGLNAWADGSKFAVTARMMQFAASDNELAFVIAHEMAHNILAHARRLKGQSGLLSKIGFGNSKIKEAEIEADQMGVKILLDTGYTIDGALSTLARVRGKRPFDLAQTHPGITRRLQIVLASAEQWTVARKALILQASATNALAKVVQTAGLDQPQVAIAVSGKPVNIGSSDDDMSSSILQAGIESKSANLSILWKVDPVGKSTAFL